MVIHNFHDITICHPYHYIITDVSTFMPVNDNALTKGHICFGRILFYDSKHDQDLSSSAMIVLTITSNLVSTPYKICISIIPFPLI